MPNAITQQLLHGYVCKPCYNKLKKFSDVEKKLIDLTTHSLETVYSLTDIAMAMDINSNQECNTQASTCHSTSSAAHSVQPGEPPQSPAVYVHVSQTLIIYKVCQ